MVTLQNLLVLLMRQVQVVKIAHYLHLSFNCLPNQNRSVVQVDIQTTNRHGQYIYIYLIKIEMGLSAESRLQTTVKQEC
jgi:hypothetical protein